MDVADARDTRHAVLNLTSPDAVEDEAFDPHHARLHGQAHRVEGADLSDEGHEVFAEAGLGVTPDER